MFKHKPIVTAIAMAMSNFAHADLTSGLVAYYPFNGNANDASGNGNNGIVYGATLTADRFGNASSAYNFNGQDNYIDTNLPTIDITSGYQNTVVFWMYWNGIEGVNGQMPVGFDSYDLWFRNGNFGFNTFANDVYGIISSALTNQWLHVVAIFTNGNVIQNALYINGVAQSLSQLQYSPVARPVTPSMRIGEWAHSADIFSDGYYFGGKIDDIRIYNRALSPSEITEIYTLQNPNTPLAPTCTSNAATNITLNSATLNGNVISNGTTATANFEFGPTVTYGTNVAAAPAQIYSSTPIAISANKTGLACNTTYHYRAKAVNSVGTAYGTDQSFTTLATCAPNTWLYPATPAVLVGRAFTLDIHVNSNNNTVGAYDYTVNFDPTKLLVDTTYQNAAATCEQGICPGTSALSTSNVNVDNSSGNIKLTGFDPTGTGPGNDLQLLQIYFIAKNIPGTTVVGLTTNELTNAVGEPLGNVAIGATITTCAGLCGDSDGNGSVNIVDALAIARYLVGLPPPPTVNPTLADVNRSGTVSIVDALYIARYAVGLVVTGTCPIGQPLYNSP